MFFLERIQRMRVRVCPLQLSSETAKLACVRDMMMPNCCYWPPEAYLFLIIFMTSLFPYEDDRHQIAPLSVILKRSTHAVPKVQGTPHVAH